MTQDILCRAFEKDEIMELIAGSHMIIVNKYEEKLILQKTDQSMDDLRRQTQYVIVTKGGEGSHVYTPDTDFAVPVAPAQKLCDPTGAGDAYRGGLLKGMIHNLPITTCTKLASQAASFAVECHGTQNYTYTPQEFKQRYVQNYGEDPEVDRLFS